MPSAVNPGGSTEIRFEGVGMTFAGRSGRVEALRDIEECAAAGSFVSIVGPSGCGKSTLLSITAGLHTPTTGGVRIGDRVVTGPDRGVGMVFQEDSTLAWRSTLKNVTFGMEIAGVPHAERVRRAQAMIDLVGLSGFEQVPPSALSGGMRQRVSIARTLALEPSVLLMDEPFGALDQQTRLIVGQELLRIWHETRTTILFVTHDISEAVLLAQEVWVMSHRPGRIIDRVAVALPDERDLDLVSTPEFNAITNRIWDSVRGEALLAFRQDEAVESRSSGG
jgi:NitT/TauT family transport system ATP-binding protein